MQQTQAEKFQLLNKLYKDHGNENIVILGRYAQQIQNLEKIISKKLKL